MTTCTCGCCAGVTSGTPMPVDNRPGLPAVSYRVGTHPEFLASMIAALTAAGRPKLAALTTREPDDLTIALLDAWAVVADVLTFHNERLVQESWLRTAVDRRSLQELGKLVGHRMAPGVAAQTHLAFAVEPPPTVPDAAGRDPGVAPPVTPEVIEVSAGLRVQSIPGPGEQPQTFETVAPMTARPRHNAIPAATTTMVAPAEGDDRVWLAGAASNISAGAVLLFVGGDIADDHWDVKVVDRAVVDAVKDRTEVRWTGTLRQISPAGSTALPKVFVLRKRLKVFGHNAPSWNAMSSDFKKDYTGSTTTPTDTDWPDFDLTADTTSDAVDLEGSHPDVTVDAWLVLAGPAGRALFQATSVTELSRAQFAISGGVTRVVLSGVDYDDFDDDGAPRNVVVWAVSEELDLAETPDGTAVTGDGIVVAADASQLAVGAALIVAGATTPGGTDHAEVAEVAATSPVGDSGRWLIELVDDLDEDYDRSTVVVHGNVALATHGETVDEVLGVGRGRDAFQRFRLSHGPLTHVQATTPSGVSSTLVVRVNGVAWDEVVTQYDGDAADHTFTSTVDEHGDQIVTFGDGRRGARLPTGTNNVRATYRKGIGTAGNVGPGALAQLLDRPLGLKGVSNPGAASGGVDPEGPDEARTTIPAAVRTLGRAVSLLDYEDFARAFPGVSKAQATVMPLPQGRTIVTTVAVTPGTGDDVASRLEDLTTALRDHGDPQVELVVLEHHADTFRLAMKVVADPAHQPEVVRQGVADAMATAFSFGRRHLLAPVHQSDVVAIAHEVPGVMGVDLDRLYAVDQPEPPDLLAQRLIPRQPAVSSAMTPISAGLLVIAEDPFDWLEVES